MELDHGGRRDSGPRARDRSLARIGPPHKVVFNALLDLCNVQVGSEGLVRANLGPEKSRRVIRYPNGTTTDETTPYLPSWFLNGFPVGTTRITVTATALSGPSPAPVSFSVIVRDRQAPTFLATGSVVANATSHRGARVAYPYPATLDNCGGVRVKGNPSPGTVFPIGTTHVVATATDPSGNTAKLSFDVVVKGAHEQFVAVRRAAESVAGNRARPKADAAAIERLLRDPRDKVQSRACDSLANLQHAIASRVGNPTARRAETIANLTRIRRVLSC